MIPAYDLAASRARFPHHFAPSPPSSSALTRRFADVALDYPDEWRLETDMATPNADRATFVPMQLASRTRTGAGFPFPAMCESAGLRLRGRAGTPISETASSVGGYWGDSDGVSDDGTPDGAMGGTRCGSTQVCL